MIPPQEKNSLWPVHVGSVRPGESSVILLVDPGEYEGGSDSYPRDGTTVVAAGVERVRVPTPAEVFDPRREATRTPHELAEHEKNDSGREYQFLAPAEARKLAVAKRVGGEGKGRQQRAMETNDDARKSGELSSGGCTHRDAFLEHAVHPRRTPFYTVATQSAGSRLALKSLPANGIWIDSL